MRRSSISFVLPMYNEEATIADTVRQLSSMAEELAEEYEIIIANDGSTDNSKGVSEEIARNNPRVRTVHLERNTKFGGALGAGLKRATKDIVIYTDSDLPVEMSDIKGALELMNGSDMVNAFSRVRKGENIKRIVMSKVYNFLIQLLFRTGIKDINSGLKIFKKKILDGMEFISKSPFIDVEIFVKATRKGFRVSQYPVVFKHRKVGASYISRPPVILRTVFDMIRFRITQ